MKNVYLLVYLLVIVFIAMLSAIVSGHNKLNCIKGAFNASQGNQMSKEVVNYCIETF